MNRDTGTARAFDNGFFLSNEDRALVQPRGRTVMVNPGPGRGPDRSTGGERVTVPFRQPQNLVIPAGANASDAQRDASIAANLAANMALYDPNNAAKHTAPAMTAVRAHAQQPGWRTPTWDSASAIARQYQTPGAPSPYIMLGQPRTATPAPPRTAWDAPAASANPRLLAGNPPPQIGGQMRPQLGPSMRPSMNQRREGGAGFPIPRLPVNPPRIDSKKDKNRRFMLA